MSKRALESKASTENRPPKGKRACGNATGDIDAVGDFVKQYRVVSRTAKSTNKDGATKETAATTTAAKVTATATRVLGTVSKINRRDSLAKRDHSTETLLLMRVNAKLKDEVAQRSAEIASLQRTVEDLREQLASKDAQIEAIEALRRKAVDELQDSRGKIRVVCRVRPAINSEDAGSTSVVFPEPHAVSIAGVNGVHRYDGVLRPDSTQAEVFGVLRPYVESVLDGFSCCVFAYGQTSSGKTFTLSGPNGDDEELRGVIPRAVEFLLSTAEKKLTSGWSFTFGVSFLEVYNEGLFDLLNLKGKPAIRHDSSNQPQLCSVTEAPVSSVADALELFKSASKARIVAATAFNQCSSRSHMLFRMRVKGSNGSQHEDSDLAGSEKYDKNAAQLRATETLKINTSLSTLTAVIKELAENRPHVRFRDSALTHLLQTSLSGRSKVVLIANVSPCIEDKDETISTLRFADDANNTALGAAQKSSSATKKALK